jgi:hypothetical protein
MTVNATRTQNENCNLENSTIYKTLTKQIIVHFSRQMIRATRISNKRRKKYKSRDKPFIIIYIYIII